jgi:hypothetical protein
VEDQRKQLVDGMRAAMTNLLQKHGHFARIGGLHGQILFIR